MKRCTSSRSTHRASDLDRLAAVALALTDIGPVDEAEPALAIGLVDQGATGEVLLRRLEGHPADELAGFSAPASWWAFGIVATGTARADHAPAPADTDDTTATALATCPAEGATLHATRVRTAHLVTRSGASIDVLQCADAAPEVVGVGIAGSPAPLTGRLPDLCRRALGLATAAPTEGTGALWTVAWLDRLLALALGKGADGLDWVDLAACHPAAHLLADLETAEGLVPSPLDEVADELPGLGRVLAQTWDWSDVRRACGDGAWPVFGISPGVADWMDDGLFSRWVLGEYPPAAELRAAVDHHLPPPLLHLVDVALAAWAPSRSAPS